MNEEAVAQKKKRGIEISQKTISAIDKVEAPTTKVELQSLIGKINLEVYI